MPIVSINFYTTLQHIPQYQETSPSCVLRRRIFFFIIQAVIDFFFAELNLSKSRSVHGIPAPPQLFHQLCSGFSCVKSHICAGINAANNIHCIKPIAVFSQLFSDSSLLLGAHGKISHAVIRKHRVGIVQLRHAQAALFRVVATPGSRVPRLDFTRRVAIEPIIYLSWRVDLPFQVQQPVKFRGAPQLRVKLVRDPFKLNVFFCRWRAFLCILQILHSTVELLISQIFVACFTVQTAQNLIVVTIQRSCNFSGFIVPCRPVFRRATTRKPFRSLDDVLYLMHQRALRCPAQLVIQDNSVRSGIVIAVDARIGSFEYKRCVPQLRVCLKQAAVAQEVGQFVLLCPCAVKVFTLQLFAFCLLIRSQRIAPPLGVSHPLFRQFVQPPVSTFLQQPCITVSAVFHSAVIDLEAPLAIHASEPAGFP